MDGKDIIKKSIIIFEHPLYFNDAENLIKRVYKELPGRGHADTFSSTQYAGDIDIKKGRRIEGMITSSKDPLGFDSFSFIQSRDDTSRFDGIRFPIMEHQIPSIPEKRLESLLRLWKDVGIISKKYIKSLDSGD